MRPPDSNEPNGSRSNADFLARDLDALRQVSARGLPPIDETARRLRKRAVRASREGWMMNLWNSFRVHPRLATALGVALVALILLAVPLSYDKTVGYEARLEVGNPLPEGTPASALADQFEKALGADDVSVMRSLAGAGVSIAARVPLKSRSLVESTVAAFAAEIAKLGIEASASVRPVTERVSSNVYAMAANEVVEIRVQAEGRTDEEIEEQIRSQLAAAGFLNPTVDVKMGDGQFEVEMMVSKECDDQICPPLELVIDGEQCCGEGPNEQMIELQIDARGKTPDQIKEEIEAQLAQRGIDKAKIRVHLDENGQARVEVESCGDSPQTSPKSPGLEKESWGELKEQNR